MPETVRDCTGVGYHFALRLQSYLTKVAAVVGTAGMVNLPFGAAREHTDKFSTQWFVAVHASIPFLAMLRKAIIMPRHAILFTVAGTVLGQGAGARLERRRRLRAQGEAAQGACAREAQGAARGDRPALAVG